MESVDKTGKANGSDMILRRFNRREPTETFLRSWFDRTARPRVVTLGNQKGGSGKTTAAIHLIVGLMKSGYSVASIDLDGSQATLTHFLEGRRKFASAPGMQVDMPEHRRVEPSSLPNVEKARNEEAACVFAALDELSSADFIVIDTPGSDSHIARLGHMIADRLITPINDSFLDLDVFVRIDADGHSILGPSSYTLAVLSRWGQRMQIGGKAIEWDVMLNRYAQRQSHNRRRTSSVLKELSRTLGYNVVQGLADRVIFREAFLYGLTVLDLPYSLVRKSTGKSLAAARAEIWQLTGLVDAPDGAAEEAEDLHQASAGSAR